MPIMICAAREPALGLYCLSRVADLTERQLLLSSTETSWAMGFVLKVLECANDLLLYLLRVSSSFSTKFALFSDNSPSGMLLSFSYFFLRKSR